MELETAQAQTAVEPPVVEPPPPVTESAEAMTEAGDVPDIVAEQAPEAAKPTTSDQGFNADTGIHYADEYRQECERTGNLDKWQDKYASGHTSATQFVQPYEGRYANEFVLAKGQSASEAVEGFMKGLTITDYRAAGVAVEIDEVRDEMGNQKFDSLFGSKTAGVDVNVPAAQRLKISSAAYTTPIDDQMREIGKKADLKQPDQKQPGDPAWQSFERQPQQDAQAEVKKGKAEEKVEHSPVAEAKKDKTLQ